MQRVVVFDVAASMGGAMTVLKSFYREAILYKDIQWIFVLSSNYVEPAENVTVKTYSWIKKSKLHRLFFDKFIAPTIVKKEAPDCVLSLQNINITGVKVKKITYVHQSIPFCDYRFSFRDDFVEWLYQNIIARFIFKSIRCSDMVVVQTNWMKEAVIKKTHISEDRILVSSPAVTTNAVVHYNHAAESQHKSFFYPAAYASYKNHIAIINAVQLLRAEGIYDFEVILTLDSCELPASLQRGDNIRCVGKLSFEEVQEQYSKSILLFPSILETFGLPLVEAAIVGSPVIAADLPYAREVLENYENVDYFAPDQASQLAQLMRRHIKGEYIYKLQPENLFTHRFAHSGWKPLMRYIKES